MKSVIPSIFALLLCSTLCAQTAKDKKSDSPKAETSAAKAEAAPSLTQEQENDLLRIQVQFDSLAQEYRQIQQRMTILQQQSAALGQKIFADLQLDPGKWQIVESKDGHYAIVKKPEEKK